MPGATVIAKSACSAAGGSGAHFCGGNPNDAFGPDNCTRIMLFAGNLHLQSGESFDVVTADAEDESHQIYSLRVEYVGPVPDQDWATAVVVRLNEQMGDVGDVLVRIY